MGILKNNHLRGNKGYTLLEMIFVVFMLSMILTFVAIVYISLVRASILVSDYYQALENVRLGTEKVWRYLKYGWDFQVTSTQIGIMFKDKNCNTTTIRLDGSSLNLEQCFGATCNLTSVFDSSFVGVSNFLIATDTPDTTTVDAYYKYAPKVIILYYNLELKSKRGSTTTLEFQQAVAPVNSVLSRSLCQ